MGKRVAVYLLVLLVSVSVAAQHKVASARIICTPPQMKVLKMVRPVFPPDAKVKNAFGAATVEVEINKMGMPSAVKAIKGDPLLVAAVVEAVKKWRWKPVMLNGVPVEATTMITVNFEPR